MVIAHGDLPFATSFKPIASLPGIVVVPDVDKNGTNVLSLPTQASFVLSYGEGSFAKHLTAAQHSGFATTVVTNDALAHDVDQALDVAALVDHPNYSHIFERNEPA